MDSKKIHWQMEYYIIHYKDLRLTNGTRKMSIDAIKNIKVLDKIKYLWT